MQSVPTQDKIHHKLKKFIDSQNCCEFLDEKQLQEIGNAVIHGAETDEASREEWSKQLEDALKMVKQVGDLDSNTASRKTTPFQGSADVKFPLMLNACIQFNARINPEIVQGDKVVYMDVMREDPTGQYEEIGKRLTAHMSYQLLGKNDHWRSDTDKLLMILPMVGIVFRKSFWNDIKEMPDAELCLPDDIIVNNKTKSLGTAFRITHKIYLSDNDIIERQRSGLYSDIDLDKLGVDADSEELDNLSELNNSKYASRRMFELYEQHTYLDLDEDGYKEPYIVIVHKQTQIVLRIVARYDEKTIITNKMGKLIRIDPINYFTAYHFIPSPDGNFYSMGFGNLLFPLNVTINKSINNLLDSGTLANMQAGFIGKGLRVKKASEKFELGEYKYVDAQAGVSIKDNLVPLPVRDPSPIIFQLVEFMVKAAQETANISDVMQGQTPGANTPATTVLSLVEQGTKVFSSILYRLYQSFKQEFDKLYEMNKKYFDKAEFYRHSMTSGMINPDDYRLDDFAIIPVADPATSTEAQRLMRAQTLMEMMGKPGINNYEVMKRFLEALKVPNIDKILSKPDPNAPPPPEVQKIMAEIKQINTETGLKVAREDLEALKVELDQRDLHLRTEIAAGNLAAQKIKSITEIAQAEAMGQPVEQAKAFEQPIEQEASMQIPDETQPIAQQLGVITGQIQPQQQQDQGQQMQGQQGQIPIEEQLMGDQGQERQDSGVAPQNPELQKIQGASQDITGISGLSPQMKGAAQAIQRKTGG